MEFSVIVPVYRVEAYLKKCVDSILSQTFPDFELILVDDGSPDRCPYICDTYAARDERVHVIHKKNGGVVSARKRGLMEASGKYVVFLDGDDWAAHNFLERGHALMEAYEADMICVARSHEDGRNSKTEYEPAPEGLYKREDIQKNLYPMILMDSGLCHLSYSVFKIFTRLLANECFLGLDEKMTLGEDMLSIVLAYQKAERIYISRELLGFYRVRDQSVCHSFQIGQYGQIRRALWELKKMHAEFADRLPADFDRQIERYGAYMCFVLSIHAAASGAYPALGEIRRQLRHPRLRSCLIRARLGKISLKTRLTLQFLKWGWPFPAFLLLVLCRRIKGDKAGIRRERGKW